MKRIICALLTVVMLAAMIPAFTVATSAAYCPAPEIGYVKINPVSHSDNNGIDWSLIWTDTNHATANVVRLGADFSEKVEIIGQFETPTKPNKIVFCSQYYGNRMHGVTVSLSVNGEDWVEVAKETGENLTQGWFVPFTYAIDSNGTEYSYIKISQETSNPLGFDGAYTFDCPWVAVYDDNYVSATNVYPTYDIPEGYTPITVAFQSATTNYNASGDTTDWSTMWQWGDSALKALNIAGKNTKEGHADYGKEYSTDFEIIGKFANSSISKVVFYYINGGGSAYPQRCNNVDLSMSVDGETWVKVGRVTHNANHGTNGGGKTTYIVVDIPEEYRDTVYSYVKLSRTGAGWFGFNYCMLLTEKMYPTNSTRIGTTVVDAYCDNAKKIWSNDNVVTVSDVPADSAKGYYSVAKLDSPTVIDKVVFTSGSSGDRGRGAYIYASVDGNTWDRLGSLPGTLTNHTSYSVSATSNKTYNYVKIEKTNWKYNWSALQISVFGYAETDDRAEVVSYESSPAGESANIWADDNTTIHKGTDGDGVSEYSIATLENPMIVSDIYFSNVNGSGRNRQVQFFGSLDGENWVRLAYNWRPNNAAYDYSTQHFVVENPVACKYIKVDNAWMGDWAWNVVNVAVYGKNISAQAIDTVATFAGAQTKIDSEAGTYSVRFLATVDELALSNLEVGFVIQAVYSVNDNHGQQMFTIPTSTVYTKVMVGNDYYEAKDLLGGENNEYICAVAIRGISIEKYDDITFVVQTYVKTEDGTVVYGDMGTVVINDGAEVK